MGLEGEVKGSMRAQGATADSGGTPSCDSENRAVVAQAHLVWRGEDQGGKDHAGLIQIGRGEDTPPQDGQQVLEAGDGGEGGLPWLPQGSLGGEEVCQRA